MTERGKYIVIEGPDGTGKTTQAQLLVDTLAHMDIPSRYVHEPGETPIGIEIEKILKDRTLGRTAMTDLLLFTVNRRELYEQVIQPELENGTTIVADRNWLSSIAYQGYAAELGESTVRSVTKAYLPDEYMYPDFTALLYLSDQQRQKLLGNRGTSGADYFETQPDEFQTRLIQGYEAALERASGDTHTPSKHISAEGTIHEVHLRIMHALGKQGIIHHDA